MRVLCTDMSLSASGRGSGRGAASVRSLWSAGAARGERRLARAGGAGGAAAPPPSDTRADTHAANSYYISYI